MINKEDGDKIRAYIKSHEEEYKEGYGNFAILKISFEMKKPDDRVEYDIWFSSAETNAIKFINKLRKFNDRLGDKVLMTPHYVTWNCGD
jgi:hypothetical protein